MSETCWHLLCLPIWHLRVTDLVRICHGFDAQPCLRLLTPVASSYLTFEGYWSSEDLSWVWRPTMSETWHLLRPPTWHLRVTRTNLYGYVWDQRLYMIWHIIACNSDLSTHNCVECLNYLIMFNWLSAKYDNSCSDSNLIYQLTT